MILQPSASPALSEPLRFACSACGSALEVPAVLAGVTGPCPVCNEEITAPAGPEKKPAPAPAANAARLLSRPPPVRPSPPPLAPVPVTAPVRPSALPAEPVPVEAAAEPEVLPFPVPAPVPPPEMPPRRVSPIIPPDEPPRRLLAANVAPVFPVPLVPIAVEPVSPPEEFFPEPPVPAAPAEPEKKPVRPIVLREPESAPAPAPAPALRLDQLPPFYPPSALPPAPVPEPPPAARRPRPLEERGIFKEGAGAQGVLLDIHTDIPLRTRHNWRRWVDIGIVSVFTGLLLATVAALRYTVPMDTAPPSWPPANLTQQVEQEMQMQHVRQQEAGELACAAVNRYLGAASELAASSYLLPPPPGMDAPSFPPFLSPPTEWTVSDSKRIPFTDRYLTIVKPAAGELPVFVVEQTENGLRLHSGPIAQQSMHVTEKFLASAGQGEATLYAEVRPTVPGFERGYRATRPDLDSYRLVDVMPSFTEKPATFIACFKPGSEAAMYFSRRGAHDLNWRRVLVQVRWQVHREAGPWVEVVKFIPGSWSGDPPFPAPSATASLSPAN